MSHEDPSDEVLRKLLTEATTIAMVGASSQPDRPSHGMFRRMRDAGYRVIPVNPRERAVLGVPAVATLEEVPVPVDIVDVFRRAEHAPALAASAVRIGARALWLQQGVVSEEAAAVAEAGGLLVVMDRCIGVAHALLRVPRR